VPVAVTFPVKLPVNDVAVTVLVVKLCDIPVGPTASA